MTQPDHPGLARGPNWADQGIERPLPASLDAERGILGAILLDSSSIILNSSDSALAKVADKIKTHDFFGDHHQRIYAAMLALHGQRQVTDLLTLTDFLRDRGELQLSGGAGYLASLVDGVPRVCNIEHYAKIVREKAEKRRVVHFAHALEQQALDGISLPTELHDRMEIFLRGSATTNGHGKHAVFVDLADFLTEDLRPLSFLMDPVLAEQDILMVHAWRGLGKTFFILDLAVSVALGLPKFGPWDIPGERRVLYVDGEMSAKRLQDRLRKICKGHYLPTPPKKRFILCTPDKQQDNQPPNIGTAEGQRKIEEGLESGMLLVIDSLSTLLRMPKEDDEAWFCVQEWLLRLRQRMITIVILHHSGKSGAQRGTSKREDFLNTVITLKRPPDYAQSQGLRAELHFEKSREAAGLAVMDHELKMEEPDEDSRILTWRPLRDLVAERVRQMLADGAPIREISEDCHLSRFQVYRLRDKLKRGEPIE